MLLFCCKSFQLFVFAIFRIAMRCSAADTAGRIGVAFASLTVRNLERSTVFYTKVLGGMEVAELGSKGEGHFGMDYQTVFVGNYGSPEELSQSIPNISQNGTHLIKWSFILFDNMLLQLLQFPSRSGFEEAPEQQASSITPAVGTQIAFWVWDSVNMTEYVDAFEKKAQAWTFNSARFSRPVLLASNATSRDANDNIKTYRENMLSGLSIGYATGPDGERLKFIQLLNNSRETFGRHYCLSKTVSAGYMDRYTVDRCARYKRGLSAHLFGVNHMTIPTTDINATLHLFTDKLGGHFVGNVQPSNLKSPSLDKIMCKKGVTNDTRPVSTTTPMDSTTFGETTAQFSGDGSQGHSLSPPDVSELQPTMELNLRYVLMRNVMLELSFITGSKSLQFQQMLTAASKSFTVASPGHVALFMDILSECDMAKVLQQVDPVSETIAFEDGPLADMTFARIQASDIGQLSLVYFGDKTREILHTAMLQYGAVSSLYTDTDPWLSDRYNRFCPAQRSNKTK